MYACMYVCLCRHAYTYAYAYRYVSVCIHIYVCCIHSVAFILFINLFTFCIYVCCIHSVARLICMHPYTYMYAYIHVVLPGGTCDLHAHAHAYVICMHPYTYVYICILIRSSTRQHLRSVCTHTHELHA